MTFLKTGLTGAPDHCPSVRGQHQEAGKRHPEEAGREGRRRECCWQLFCLTLGQPRLGVMVLIDPGLYMI